MERFTFISDGYYAVSNDDCYEDQNENYCGPAIERLAKYEEANINGELAMFPFKYHDTVWVTWWGTRVEESVIDGFGWSKEKGFFAYIPAFKGSHSWDRVTLDMIGKDVFLNKKDAEEAIERMKNK